MRAAGWVMSSLRSLPSLLLPQKRVLEKAADRAHRGLDDSHPPIEESAAQQILPPEMRGGTQRDIAPTRASSARRERARARLRIRDELLDVVAQVAVGGMIQLLCECPDVAETLKAGMHGAATVPKFAPGETHHPIIGPVAAAHDPPLKLVAALHPIRFVRRCFGARLHGHQLLRQLWADALIGVEREDPFVPGDRDTAVALLADATRTVRDDARARSARERYRVVRGSAVHDHDVGGPVEVADARDDLFRLIARGNDYGDRCPHAILPWSGDAPSLHDTRPRCAQPRGPDSARGGQSHGRRGPPARRTPDRRASARAQRPTLGDPGAARAVPFRPTESGRGFRPPARQPLAGRAPSPPAVRAKGPRSGRAARPGSLTDRTRAAGR